MPEERQETKLHRENRRPGQDQIHPIELGEEIDLDQQRIEVRDARAAGAKKAQRIETGCFDQVDGGERVEQQTRRAGQADTGQEQQPVVQTQPLAEVEADGDAGDGDGDGNAKGETGDDLEGNSRRQSQCARSIENLN